MIVEFIGLPASGKSTLVQRLLDDNSNERLTIYNPFLKIYSQSWFQRNLYKTLQILIFSLKNITKTINLITVILHTQQRSIKDLIRVSFNFLFFFVLYEKYTNSKNIILLDEGFFHNIWAVIYSSKNKERLLDELFELETNPNVLIKVNCSNDEILERLLNRKSNTRIENETNISEIIDSSKKDIEVIINALKNSKIMSSVKICEVNNDSLNSLEKNTEMILELIIKEREFELC